MLLSNGHCLASQAKWSDEADVADLLDLVALVQVDSFIGANLNNCEQLCPHPYPDLLSPPPHHLLHINYNINSFDSFLSIQLDTKKVPNKKIGVILGGISPQNRTS